MVSPPLTGTAPGAQSRSAIPNKARPARSPGVVSCLANGSPRALPRLCVCACSSSRPPRRPLTSSGLGCRVSSSRAVREGAAQPSMVTDAMQSSWGSRRRCLTCARVPTREKTGVGSSPRADPPPNLLPISSQFWWRMRGLVGSGGQENRPPTPHNRRSAADSFCAPGAIRTPDTWFRKPVLYPLSYGGKGGDGSRSWQLGPHGGAAPGSPATARRVPARRGWGRR